jgi:hypothetical protein
VSGTLLIRTHGSSILLKRKENSYKQFVNSALQDGLLEITVSKEAAAKYVDKKYVTAFKIGLGSGCGFCALRHPPRTLVVAEFQFEAYGEGCNL